MSKHQARTGDLLGASVRLGRREALLGSVGVGVAALGLLPSRPAHARAGQASAETAAPLFKISLVQTSLRREFASGALAVQDFAQFANRMGLNAVEYVGSLFGAKLREGRHLAELKRRAADHGVWSCTLRADAGGPLASGDKADRLRQVDSYKQSVEAAAYLGCHAIGVRLQGDGDADAKLKAGEDGLRRLCQFADDYGVDVLVENSPDLSPDWVAELVTAVGHQRCGTLPSFGGFGSPGSKVDPAPGMRTLMPVARGVAATASAFDSHGDERTFNYPLLCKIVIDSGYHGYVGIDYRGTALSETAGIERTIQLLRRVQDTLTSRSLARR